MRNLIVCLNLAAFLACGADRATITGQIVDAGGRPMEHATVLVRSAGVKVGYSAYCPSCYPDCGKRAETGRDGTYSIAGLDPALRFNLMVVREGYAPLFIERIDPSRGPASLGTLELRPAVSDLARIVRGRVVDSDGQPQRNAVVTPIGVDEATAGSSYFGVDGLERAAATNAKGEFELAYSKPAIAMLLRVEARGMAPGVVVARTGGEMNIVPVSVGAVIHGRLVNKGTPVANALVGLIPQERFGYGASLKVIGDPFDEVRIGTRDDGSFFFANVPPGVKWYVYGKMESISRLGATDPVKCATARDGEEINAGDIEIHPGHRLRGHIELSNGAPLPKNSRITVVGDQSTDSQTVLLNDGKFELVNLPAGKLEILPSVRGYQARGEYGILKTTIGRDMDDFTIVVDPARRP
jgi:hypothetical protein